MKSRSTWILMLFASFTSAGFAADAPTANKPADPGDSDRPALALVGALQADQLTVAGVRYALIHDTGAVLPKSVRDCLAGMDYSFTRDAYVEIVQKVMTPQEIGEALSFYQSHAGHMMMMDALRQMRDRLEGYPGLAEADAAGEPSDEDRRQMKAFDQSPVARKIGQIQSGPEADKVVDQLVQKMAEQCLKQP
jgi:hypothetical protein